MSSKQSDSRLVRWWVLGAGFVAVTTTGMKCFDYDPELEDRPSDASVAADLVPFEACSVANTAQITVRNTAFIIDCGCVEERGRQCTIPLGTSVRWSFEDSESHNVVFQGMLDRESDEQLTGVWTQEFGEAGVYDYKCSIHPQEMSDYTVVVQ